MESNTRLYTIWQRGTDAGDDSGDWRDAVIPVPTAERLMDGLSPFCSSSLDEAASVLLAGVAALPGLLPALRERGTTYVRSAGVALPVVVRVPERIASAWPEDVGRLIELLALVFHENELQFGPMSEHHLISESVFWRSTAYWWRDRAASVPLSKSLAISLPLGFADDIRRQADAGGIDFWLWIPAVLERVTQALNEIESQFSIIAEMPSVPEDRDDDSLLDRHGSPLLFMVSETAHAFVTRHAARLNVPPDRFAAWLLILARDLIISTTATRISAAAEVNFTDLEQRLVECVNLGRDEADDAAVNAPVEMLVDRRIAAAVKSAAARTGTPIPDVISAGVRRLADVVSAGTIALEAGLSNLYLIRARQLGASDALDSLTIPAEAVEKNAATPWESRAIGSDSIPLHAQLGALMAVIAELNLPIATETVPPHTVSSPTRTETVPLEAP